MVKNTELLAIAMDTLGVAGRMLHQATNLSSSELPIAIRSHNIVEQIWTRALSGGDVAICFFNRDEHPRNMSVAWAAAADHLRHPLRVRNIWLHNSHGGDLEDSHNTEGFSTIVPKHAVTMIRVAGSVADPHNHSSPWHLKLDDTAADQQDLVPCPCSDAAHCKPVTKVAEREVFVFHSPGTFNTIIPGPSDFLKFDWKTLTTVALVGPMNFDLLCHAHSHGVRVVFGWGMGAFCPGWFVDSINATAEQKQACIATPGDWENETLADLWVAQSVAYLQSVFVDGVNMDLELPTPRDSVSRRGEVELSRRLTVALHAAVPGSQVSVTTASLHLGPYQTDADYRGLAEVIDYLVPMDYDSGAGLYAGQYYASSNMHLSLVKYGVDSYLRLGVPAHKLVLTYPW